jgi:LPXTG-motif cell wall-anchored protein
MVRSHGRWVGGLAGIILALTVAGTAAAYWTQTPATVTIFGPEGNIKCGQWVTFRAVIRDHEGDRIADGGPVTWSFDTSFAGDQIDPTVTTTDSQGRATTSVFFACEPGDRVLRATADAVSGTMNVTVHVKDQFEDQRIVGTAAGGLASGRSGDTSATLAKNGAIARASGVLPNTSTEPTTAPTLVAMLALLVGIGLVVRRTATLRR